MSQANSELETAIKQLDRKTFEGLPELVKAGMRAGKLGCATTCR